MTPEPALLPELAGHPRYRVVKELGRGGMGVVYLAEHRLMDRRVAVKVINRGLLTSPGMAERFLREVRAAAKLSHPNIVTAYEAEQLGDLLLLVMEYVDGVSLADYVGLKKVLPVSHACHFARQAALGLQHAHERGLVHRDIKPGNLLMTCTGEVKVADFGLATVVSERGPEVLTAPNVMMGTPEFMAPEQAADAHSADIRSDIYSLGCTLYYLLAGRPPFRGSSVAALLLAHQQRPVIPLPSLRQDVPQELWTVVGRMLDKHPSQRHAEPVEVARELQQFCPPGGNLSPANTPGIAPLREGASLTTLVLL